MKQIKAVIFDMDGILFDTERLSKEVWNSVGEKWNCEFDEDFLSGLRGGNLAMLKEAFFKKFGQDFDFESIRKEKRQLFLNRLETEGVPVKKGAAELLPYLKEQGYLLALATGSASAQTMWNLQAAGFEDWFDVIVCGDQVTKSKPNPEIFLKAAEKLHTEPEQCLVIEDSINGITAALNGGFCVVMVPDLTMPDEHIRQRVDGVLKDLTEVPVFLGI